MSINLHVGRRSYLVGSASFFGAFFSTVYVRLEAQFWGARFPVVMGALYAGEVSPSEATTALAELNSSERNSSGFHPMRWSGIMSIPKRFHPGAALSVPT